jgi:Asp-tRNA(Asn)/Glu-tRNA(Gln) amidotransferase A subunit family amidase
MSKKWYNLFVSVDSPTTETPEEGGSPAPVTAAQAVADIAAATAVAQESHFTGTVANPSSFDDIYNAAEIQAPVHGFTIMKVGEMLRSEHIRNLPKDVKRSSVLVALEAAGAPIQEVIEDAVKRDHALDTYERVQEKALADLEAQKSRENAEIEADLDRIVTEHRNRMQGNTDAVAKERERFYGWRLKKQEEEQKISDAVSYFVTANPITTGNSAAAAAPDAPNHSAT